MAIGDQMTDREIAEEAHKLARDVLDSNRNLQSIAGRALAVVDEYREGERKMVGAATLANMHFKRLNAIHFDFFRAVLEFRDELREVGEDNLADDLDRICSASMSSLENSFLQEPGKMH